MMEINDAELNKREIIVHFIGREGGSASFKTSLISLYFDSVDLMISICFFKIFSTHYLTII
jgi:hypothetical protein